MKNRSPRPLGRISMTRPVTVFSSVPIAERASRPPPHGMSFKSPFAPVPVLIYSLPPQQCLSSILHLSSIHLTIPLPSSTLWHIQPSIATSSVSRSHIIPLPSGKLTATFFTEHLVRCTTDAVDYAMGRGSSSDIRGRRSPRSPLRTNFAEFAIGVIQKSQVTLPIILVALVYIERSRPHLFIELEQWACERIFLGALVVASKVSLDPSSERGFILLI